MTAWVKDLDRIPKEDGVRTISSPWLRVSLETKQRGQERETFNPQEVRLSQTI